MHQAHTSRPLLGQLAAPLVQLSELDLSANYVWSLGDGKALEARYVRRTDDYFIAYLSSQTGCNQACRFCHLTSTRQTSFDQAAMQDYLRQAETVLIHYDLEVESGRQAPAQRVHFNWMARGEPLLNPAMLRSPQELLQCLSALAHERGLAAQFNISSIFPKQLDLHSLAPLASQPGVQFFYSLYSLDPDFRRRWLPKAHDPREVLDFLSHLQRRHRVPVTLHWAVIEGENDSEDQAASIADAVRQHGLVAKFNLVRYNPYSPAQGSEAAPEKLQRTFEIISRVVDSARSRIVPRVGSDVKASCGMFVQAS